MQVFVSGSYERFWKIVIIYQTYLFILDFCLVKRALDLKPEGIENARNSVEYQIFFNTCFVVDSILMDVPQGAGLPPYFSSY